ncbi:MAG: hypothetical protein QXU98_07395 [Candidatus Parvarchaeota archaeon]
MKIERIIDVKKIKRKYITAFCYLRNEERVFRRNRIKILNLLNYHMISKNLFYYLYYLLCLINPTNA